MKKTLSILAAAALLAACQPSEDPAEAFREALPSKESVQVGTPSATASGALKAQSAALGEDPLYRSEYAVITYWTAVTVNVGIVATLGLVEWITAFPPTTCGDQACTWGPWVGDAGLNRYKLDVEKQGDGYAYALSAENAVQPAGYVTLLSGVAFAGVDRHHGSGNFTLFFDAQDALAHGPAWTKKDYGELAITYDNRAHTEIGAVLLGGRNADDSDPHFMNLVYQFVSNGQVGTAEIALENLDTTEWLTLVTRWNGSGAGRGDVHYVYPGLADLTASECWAGESQGWVEVYDTKGPFGTVEACPGDMRTPAEATVSLP